MPLVPLILILLSSVAAVISFYGSGISEWYIYAWPLTTSVCACLAYSETHRANRTMYQLVKAVALLKDMNQYLQGTANEPKNK